MWNPFRKNSPPQQPSGPQQSGGPPANRVDELANRLQREGRAGALEHELEKLEKAELTRGELESWWHLYGITAFRAGRQQEATQRFETGYRLFPESAHIRFSLGQQYVNGGQTDLGFELFGACVFPEVPREYVLAQVRYAYLWNRYADGLAMLRPFFTFYQKLKILDDHFLYVRGLPFFGTWWSYLGALSILAGETQELETVTEYVSQNCYDYDFEYLNAELVACRDDHPQLLLPFLEKRLSAARGDFPNGYNFMMKAVIQARSAATAAQAERLLDGVESKQNDFPWLPDIRTLAKAEVAHRFSQRALEEQRVKDFIARQPMLFEPDIALNFHLLRYQEELKRHLQHMTPN